MITFLKSEGNSIFFKLEGISECSCDSVIEYLMQYRPSHENIEIIYDLDYSSRYEAYLIEAILRFKDRNFSTAIEDIIEIERINIEEYYN